MLECNFILVLIPSNLNYVYCVTSDKGMKTHTEAVERSLMNMLSSDFSLFYSAMYSLQLSSYSVCTIAGSGNCDILQLQQVHMTVLDTGQMCWRLLQLRTETGKLCAPKSALLMGLYSVPSLLGTTLNCDHGTVM